MIDILREIFDGLKRNKLRTFLTGFAVAWGIFMLIVLLGSGNGLIHAFTQNSSDLPSNVVTIYNGFTSMPYEGLQSGRMISLEDRDMDFLKKQFPDRVETAESTISSGSMEISVGTNYVSSSLEGVFPGIAEMSGIKMISGRFINEIDQLERRKVLVLSLTTAKILFPLSPESAVGTYVKAGNTSYKIVGIYKDDQMGSSPSIYVPFHTLKVALGKDNSVDLLRLRTKNMESVEKGKTFEKELRQVMGKRHRFDSEDQRAIWVSNRFEQMATLNTATNVLNIAIWIIGIFTLLSGIVGVSNIMLITVKERTHEFGIRKALGARPRSILTLVITESVLITAFFGYIGMVLGVAATEYLNYTMGSKVVNVGIGEAVVFLDPTVDITVAIQATLTLIIAGTLAGFIPARKAAHVKPIEALRAE